ncbi:MAG: YggS family pyridoxal phosphate-dependent enzyme [Candidatus Actinomarina sp.]|nr:YggS family pyridoxal phosphate-dependent enzyme [Candidatus Actinomarina sp.]
MDLNNLEKIVTRVSKFDCKLLPVVKNQDIKSIKNLIEFGITDLGENRLEELNLHQKYFSDAIYHFIAPLQSRKISEVLLKCSVLHSVSRKKEIDLISKYYSGQQIFIQVNIDNDPNKSGIDKNNVNNFVDYMKSKGIEASGLMCIPNIESERKIVFSEMQKLNNNLKNKYKNYSGELSMGMSDDYEIALDYGATIVRIGSKIFL